MKETGKHTERTSRYCRKGFISTWYLSIFLYTVTLISIMMLNDQKRLTAMDNLKTAQEFLSVETAVIQDIRCMIFEDSLLEGMHECGYVEYALSVSGNMYYAEIISPYEELMTVTADENGILLDMEITMRQTDP